MGFHVLEKPARFLRLAGAVNNWPGTLLDHLGLARAEYRCSLRSGLQFQVRPGTDDRHVIFEIFADQIYRVNVSPGDVVIDIGAHIGCFSLWVASKGAQVLAFEPFPENFAALQRNLQLNRITRVQPYQMAVSDRRGVRRLVLPDNAAHTGRYSFHPGRGARTVEVSCVSLDDIISEHQLTRIDVLKIDCQGSEYEILYHTSPGTLAKTRSIVMECELFEEPLNWSLACMQRYLEDHGFETHVRERLIHACKPGVCG
ncbi:MAG: FkbM family methyltransferase [Acidobacteria bacterium]|nr:FkbM family methyltransferase [Acidobacteriota bacterium]